MKKKLPTPLVDEYLQSFEGINETETGAFFYTRLKARMEKENGQSVSFPLKPAWVLSLLAFFLFINAFFLVQESKEKIPTASQGTALQNFAASYNLNISTSF